MSFSSRKKPECVLCEAAESIIWRKGIDGEVLCNECYLKDFSPVEDGYIDCMPKSNSSSYLSNAFNANGVRKSARIKPSKYRDFSRKTISTKGKSRRVVFKKNISMKAPSSVSTVVSSHYVTYNDQYFQVGDIVSVMDCDNEKIHYAQISGLLEDQYMEKSCVITWLLPTTASPTDRFDPSTYIIGPEEDFPRKLEYFEFVCHAPSDYFKQINSPYPTLPDESKTSFMWTNLGPEIIDKPSASELFGLSEPLSSINHEVSPIKDKGSHNNKKKMSAKEKRARKTQLKLEKELI